MFEITDLVRLDDDSLRGVDASGTTGHDRYFRLLQVQNPEGSLTQLTIDCWILLAFFSAIQTNIICCPNSKAAEIPCLLWSR